MNDKQLMELADKAKQVNLFFEENLDERSKQIAHNAAMQAVLMTRRRPK